MSIKGAMNFDRRHIVFSNFAHAISGFGLALLLQDHFSGHAFMYVGWGWIFLAIGLYEHLLAWTSKGKK